MKKMAMAVVCFGAVAVLWLSCFRSEARQFVDYAGGDLSWRQAAASAESGGPGAPHSDSIAPRLTASDVTTRAALAQPDANGVLVPFQGSGRFDHLVADSSSEEAMAPPKSDTTDTPAARIR